MIENFAAIDKFIKDNCIISIRRGNRVFLASIRSPKTP
jgi:hypothetical protein